MNPKDALSHRLEILESHLRSENPSLLPVIPTFRQFDRLLYRTGLLSRTESLATRIPWWPMISILGTFSAGKSSFINSHLGMPIQSTGNQAIDDKFTVICYGADTRYEALPGTALNADPRFPFYRIGDELEKVSPGEGKRIDNYLQLKTCSSEQVRGKILIDSPGFDADDQRRSILRLTAHIIDLSDLVLIFFDARRPEPGAMQDTLQHLVSNTVQRADARKFIYILNQVDATAREDNLEDVFGAWQRSIAQAGLISGKFYGIFNKKAAPPITDPEQRARYEAKSDADLAEILGRIADVDVGRSYRIVGILDAVANELEGEIVPMLQAAMGRWRKQVLVGDGVWVAALALLLVGGAGYGLGLDLGAGLAWLADGGAGLLSPRLTGALVVLAGLFLGGHFWLRQAIARRIAATLPERMGHVDLDVRAAFLKNSRFFRSLFRRLPTGWGAGTRRRLFAIREAVARHVQTFNDLYTDPAGHKLKAREAQAPAADTQTPAGQSPAERTAPAAGTA